MTGRPCDIFTRHTPCPRSTKATLRKFFMSASDWALWPDFKQLQFTGIVKLTKCHGGTYSMVEGNSRCWIARSMGVTVMPIASIVTVADHHRTRHGKPGQLPLLGFVGQRVCTTHSECRVLSFEEK